MSERGCLAGAGALLAAVVVVVLVLVAIVVVVGLSGSPLGAADPPGDDPRIGPTLEVRARDDGEFTPLIVVGDLGDDQVVRLVARGFTADHDGTARQCAGGGAVAPLCGPPVPVRFDDRGTATTLFLLDADVPGWGRCDAAGARCELVVADGDGHVGAVRTVFDGPAPDPPTVVATPARGIVAGDPLDVVVEGAPPGAAVALALCAPPALTVADCAGPGAPARADARGIARASLAADDGDGVRCGRRDPCRVAVLVDGQVQAASRRLAFASGPGPGYDGERLALGLLAAAALLLGAWTIARSTTWTTPDAEPEPEPGPEAA